MASEKRLEYVVSGSSTLAQLAAMPAIISQGRKVQGALRRAQNRQRLGLKPVRKGAIRFTLTIPEAAAIYSQLNEDWAGPHHKLPLRVALGSIHQVLSNLPGLIL